ncbi:MAG: biotin/lipoyl-containing protein, partial [Dokdonella sp.]
GNVIHLFERDCSIQRRHQKVIEEAPSPVLTPQLRAAMGAAACAAARSVGYVGAGTVEFLLDSAGKFYFMEMNTRLQVEHPVTEMITGLDLVEWQLRVARGEPLPSQQQIEMRGHAVEARLYAEDAERGFLPQSGRLLRWRPSHTSHLARTDHALADGLEITSDYDPLLAKVIAHGATRGEARQHLIAALRDTQVLGLTSNKAFLLGCLEHPEFTAGRADTDFIATHFSDQADIPPAAEALAAAALLLLAQARARLPQPWLANWHSAGLARSLFDLNIGKKVLVGLVPLDATHYRVESAAGSFEVEQLALDAAAIHLAIGGMRQRIAYAMENEQRLHLDIAGRNVVVEDLSRLPPQVIAAAGSGVVTPPMNGRIVALHVHEGQTIERGTALLTLESMKMEHVLQAACAGIVTELVARVGDQVAPGQRLALIQDAKTSDTSAA